MTTETFISIQYAPEIGRAGHGDGARSRFGKPDSEIMIGYARIKRNQFARGVVHSIRPAFTGAGSTRRRPGAGFGASEDNILAENSSESPAIPGTFVSHPRGHSLWYLRHATIAREFPRPAIHAASPETEFRDQIRNARSAAVQK